jgi:hypothetical protein
MTHTFRHYKGGANSFVELDPDGLPMAKPIYFEPTDGGSSATTPMTCRC